MVRESFCNYIKDIEKDVLDMGEMVIAAINRSIEALKAQDIEGAKRIVADDMLINKKRWDLEEKCVHLIATQQPVATDLREIVAVLCIATELERMGDYAEGIGKIVIMYGSEPLIKPLIDIPRMADKAVSMLKKSLKAFINRDAEAATALCSEDDEVDALYEQVYRELLTFMIENPALISRATYLIWAAHNLERIADRVTNICERIVFLVTGIMTELKVSRY